MKLSSIRQKASQVLDTLIPENSWIVYADALDQEGKFTKKITTTLILTICQHLEEMEQAIMDLQYQIAKDGLLPQKPKVKLRTAADIHADMDTQGDVPAYYVDSLDWHILEKSLDAKLAKTDPNYGFGKDIDPKDNKEKTCLFYKSKPVFKQ